MSNPSAPATEMNPTTLLIASASGRIYSKSLGDPTAPVVSILTYPTPDYAGDKVKPDGGDWSKYPEHPYVNWTHRVPIGRGSVSHRVLNHEGRSTPVAVGTTTFFKTKADTDGIDLRRRDPQTHFFWNKEPAYTVDEVLTVAAQAEKLIRDDIATGTSIEFLDTGKDRKGVDWFDLPHPSVLEQRPARQFDRWIGRGYAHARQPVNPGCMTLTGQGRVSDREGAAFEKAITIAQTGKLPGGEILSPLILKAFDDLKSYRSPSVSVTVPATPPPAVAPLHVKSDDKETSTTATNTDTSTPGGKLGAGHQTALDISQGLMDLCKRAEENNSDDLSLRKFFKKLCGKMKDIAGEIKARAEKHKGKIDAHDKGEDTDDDTDPMDEDDYEPSMEEKAIELDPEGVIIVKSFDWKPRRMSFANLVPVDANPTPAVPAPPAVTVDRKLKKVELKAHAKLAASIDALNQLVEAAAANGRL